MLPQEFGPVHAVVHIDDAPIESEPLAIVASEPRAAAVIDVEYRDPPAGPELYPEIERARCRRGGAAVTFDKKRRSLERAAA